MIEAVTFDFWDTIAVDDSDEPKRRRLGLPSKADARIQLFVDHIGRYYPQIAPQRAAEAYRQANDRFRHDWHNHHRTPSVRQRINFAYECLEIHAEPGRYAHLLREIDALSREIETMEVRIAPDFAPNVHWALQTLAQEYPLGIISDAIHTTGHGIRHLLYQQGLGHFFRFMIFSDEVGASKPSPKVFRYASQAIGLPPEKFVHVGDRETNDVAGPISVGMRSILYTGVVDRGSDRTRASALCRHFSELPDLVRRVFRILLYWVDHEPTCPVQPNG
jgi:putative hydrolase of the HAD superfamily